jgi:hypothetical protein
LVNDDSMQESNGAACTERRQQHQSRFEWNSAVTNFGTPADADLEASLVDLEHLLAARDASLSMTTTTPCTGTADNHRIATSGCVADRTSGDGADADVAEKAMCGIGIGTSTVSDINIGSSRIFTEQLAEIILEDIVEPWYPEDDITDRIHATYLPLKKSLGNEAFRGTGIGGNVYAGEDEDDDDYDDADSGNVTDEHIQQLLQAYVADEEDSEIVSFLKSGASSSAAPVMVSFDGADEDGGGADDDEDDDDDDDSAALTSKPKASKQSRGNRPSKPTKETPTRGDKGEKRLARSDVRSRVEKYFQRRVSREPSQVLRYAYGGEPLWCTYPPPDISKIPCCEGCGAERVFEMQLMPALLSLPIFDPKKGAKLFPDRISTERDVKSGTAAASASSGTASSASSTTENASLATFLDKLGDTLDFGVVAVWSCPNSCDASCFEYAVVQTPPDIGI